VIFDEPHHAADHRSWGHGVRQAFDLARRRLSITGTPFRSDSNAIPFITYKNGVSRSDYSYGYSEALRDGIVRPVFFPSFEGRMTWWTDKRGEMTAAFADEIPSEERPRRLRTALSPEGDWLREVLREAASRLEDVRRSQYPRAAGLVIAIDQDHARKIARELKGITGEEPAIAISEEPDASDVIKRFASGDARWIVAVRMVSEGVDIPRLCVGVYATNITTELYFRQAVGRFVRMLPNVEDQAGWLFMPKIDELVEHVQCIKEERDHVLLEYADEMEDDDSPRGGGPSGCGPIATLFTPIGAQAEADDVFYDHEAFNQAELHKAKDIIIRAGLEGMSEVIAAKLLRAAGYAEEHTEPRPFTRPLEHHDSLESQKKRLRKSVVNLVNRFIAMTSLAHREVFGMLATATGSWQGDATLEQLRTRRSLIKGWIEIARSQEDIWTLEQWQVVAHRSRQPVA
jgi:superfamily II DNA or RNA helicase